MPRGLYAIGLSALLLMSVAACEDEETAGEKVGEAVEETGEAVEETAEEAGDELDN